MNPRLARLQPYPFERLARLLRGGRIAQRGTHAQLIAQEGTYARLLRRQLLEEDLEGAVGAAPTGAEA